MDKHQEFSKWAKSLTEMLAMLETIKIMWLDYSTTLCISQSKMFLDQDNLCKISKTDSLKNKANSKILTPLEFSWTTTTMEDFWTNITIKKCLKMLFFLHWQVEEFHSTITEVNKLTQEVMILKIESPFGKIWTLTQTFTNLLKLSTRLERIKKSGSIQWMRNMS